MQENFQMVIVKIEEGKCIDAFKVRIFDDQERHIAKAIYER